MFVIPCKYNGEKFIQQLVADIRLHHKNKEILIIDSDSSDKSYISDIVNYHGNFNIFFADIKNKNYATGAYWYAYQNYPRDFYYLIHDTMRIKDNIEYLENQELSILATFTRFSIHNNMWNAYNTLTKYQGYTENSCGNGVYGPIMFLQRGVLDKLYLAGVNNVLPTSKHETFGTEGGWGWCLEQEGYNLRECSILGDILELESPGGKSGPYPHYTEWQFPIEKFYSRRA